MGRHVVGAFASVLIGKVLRRQGVERRFEVGRHVGIRVFVDRQRRRRVLDEHVEQTGPHLTHFRKRFDDLLRDEVKPARPPLEFDLSLGPTHERMARNSHEFRDLLAVRRAVDYIRDQQQCMTGARPSRPHLSKRERT